MSSDRSPEKITPVPLLDTRRQHAALQDEIEAAAVGVLRSGHYVLGPAVAELERGIAEYCGTRHAIGCASGSDALLLALMAAGIGPGDEVIVPSFTFFATASAPWRLGAQVVFADVNPQTMNLDPHDVARRLTPATRAIIPVHLFGQCADMKAIQKIAQRRPAVGKIWIIEDACQAIGAERAGHRAGGLGDIGCLSFYPTKNLGGPGDGGMLTTNDDQLAEQLRLLRGHGMQPRYYHHVIGINSRLDAIQAAILSVKLPHLDRWSDTRTHNAARYRELFAAAAPPPGALILPAVNTGSRHVWNQFVVRVCNGRRDALREHLAARQIATEIYYPLPLHMQTCFKDIGGGPGSLPQSEQAAAEVLALPISPELTESEQHIVVDAVNDFFRSGRKIGEAAVKNSAKHGAAATGNGSTNPLRAPTYVNGHTVPTPGHQRA